MADTDPCAFFPGPWKGSLYLQNGDNYHIYSDNQYQNGLISMCIYPTPTLFASGTCKNGQINARSGTIELSGVIINKVITLNYIDKNNNQKGSIRLVSEFNYTDEQPKTALFSPSCPTR